MKPVLCLACSSTLFEDPKSASSSSTTSTSKYLSEKETPPYFFNSCNHALCGACVHKNNGRLVHSCIMCETSSELLAGGRKSLSSIEKEKVTLPRYEEEVDEKASTGGFKLGQDEGDDLVAREKQENNTLSEEPPVHEDSNKSTIDSNSIDMRDASAKEHINDLVGEQREQSSVHYLRPEDTLLGLAMKYKIPGHVLASLNKLPLSTLTTTPSLLHTVPFILLPPNITTHSSKPIYEPLVERQRLALRRFQVHTRCSDWAMSNAYIASAFEGRVKEAAVINENRKNRDEIGGIVEIREGGELEEAIEAYERDLKWEVEWQKNNKGKGKMGSQIKSTGEVERDVKGWSWKV